LASINWHERIDSRREKDKGEISFNKMAHEKENRCHPGSDKRKSNGHNTV
jgi:hypothetical protein